MTKYNFITKESTTNEQITAIKALIGDLFETITVEQPPAAIMYNYGSIVSPTGLYIRTSPNLENGGIAGLLDYGQRFKVDNNYNDPKWLKILEPTAGYIYKEYAAFNETPKTISQKLVDFTASWEGFSATPYRDAGGNWTVGFGDCTYNVEPASVSYQEAWNNLESTLDNLAPQVYEIVKDMNLNQPQFDSLVDFAYNLGVSSLTYSENSDGLLSAVLKCSNNQIIQADFVAWDNCNGQPLLGLKRRRIAESDMFLNGNYNQN